MSYDRGKLASLLGTILNNTVEGIEGLEERRRFKFLGGAGTRISFKTEHGLFEGEVPEEQGPSFSILDDGVDAFDEFVQETQRNEEFRDLIGPSAVGEALDGFIRSTKGIAPSGDLKDVVRHSILKPLREAIRPWSVLVPIFNLYAKRPLELGEVTFVAKELAIQTSQSLIAAHEFGGSEEKQAQQREEIARRAQQAMAECPSFAKVCVRTHAKSAGRVAIEKALISVNVLRSFTPLFYRHSDRALFGLPSEISGGGFWSFSAAQDDKPDLQMNSHLKGWLFPFEIDEAKYDRLFNKCHMGVVDEILKKGTGDRNSLESALVQAFQALGRATVAPTLDTGFLGTVIALERMMIRDHEETTTEKLSERLALFLCDDPSERIRLHARAKELYDLRSRIVHSAYSGVREEDAREVEWWAVMTILRTLERIKEFATHDDFVKRIDRQKFGAASGA